jgi:hypothetical protein
LNVFIIQRARSTSVLLCFRSEVIPVLKCLRSSQSATEQPSTEMINYIHGMYLVNQDIPFECTVRLIPCQQACVPTVLHWPLQCH